MDYLPISILDYLKGYLDYDDVFSLALTSTHFKKNLIPKDRCIQCVEDGYFCYDKPDCIIIKGLRPKNKVKPRRWHECFSNTMQFNYLLIKDDKVIIKEVKIKSKAWQTLDWFSHYILIYCDVCNKWQMTYKEDNDDYFKNECRRCHKNICAKCHRHEYWQQSDFWDDPPMNVCKLCYKDVDKKKKINEIIILDITPYKGDEMDYLPQLLIEEITSYLRGNDGLSLAFTSHHFKDSILRDRCNLCIERGFGCYKMDCLGHYEGLTCISTSYKLQFDVFKKGERIQQFIQVKCQECIKEKRTEWNSDTSKIITCKGCGEIKIKKIPPRHYDSYNDEYYSDYDSENTDSYDLCNDCVGLCEQCGVELQWEDLEYSAYINGWIRARRNIRNTCIECHKQKCVDCGKRFIFCDSLGLLTDSINIDENKKNPQYEKQISDDRLRCKLCNIIYFASDKVTDCDYGYARELWPPEPEHILFKGYYIERELSHDQLQDSIDYRYYSD